MAPADIKSVIYEDDGKLSSPWTKVSWSSYINMNSTATSTSAINGKSAIQVILNRYGGLRFVQSSKKGNLAISGEHAIYFWIQPDEAFLEQDNIVLQVNINDCHYKREQT